MQALEFDVVLRLVSSLARTPPGARAVLQLAPASEEPAVRALLAETSEMEVFGARFGKLPLAGVDEIAPILAQLADSAGAAQASDFRPILSVARAAGAVHEALKNVESPRLAARSARLPDFRILLERARRLFAADGTVRDEASGELASLRARLRRRRSEVSSRLEKIMAQRRDDLGDSILVLRNDRYCLPVLASARSRVPGIVHDRSGSGQTVFVEPIEVIEANNDLALLAAEERREVERLLRELGREVLAAAGDLLDAVGQIAALDALEAKVEFGRLTEGRIAELSDDGGWTLKGARHPLLDARLSPLRRQVLQESRGARDVVPLDFELSPQTRLLVVSGPNAGGKTVVLKTAGLLSLMTQAGFPIPASAGTRLPVFSPIRTEIGDAQTILADRSTFSSTLETLASILEEASPNALALVDELGGATDPEEGCALAIAFLEEYLRRGGRALVSTHLSAIKNFAEARPDAVTAAMEFDEGSGRPNYRLHAGLSGRSHALSLARERGLPEPVVDRAREILGEAWQRRDTTLAEAEAALERLRQSERELSEARKRASQEADRLVDERHAAARERSRMLEEGLASFERARREIQRRVETELEMIRADASRRSEASARKIVAEAEEAVEAEDALVAAREEAQAQTLGFEVGVRARWKGTRTVGTVVSLEGETAWLEVAGKRMRIPRLELEPAGAAVSTHSNTPRPPSLRPLQRPEPVAALTREVNVIGQRLEEAISEVEKSLDEAIVSGAGRLRIVHGHGTGRLREGLRAHFRAHPAVTALCAANTREGGNGATIVELA